jgi:hypothetical protein
MVIDLDQRIPDTQKPIVQKYYDGLIPHVVVVDRFGHALYNSAGEVEEATIIHYLDKALAK